MGRKNKQKKFDKTKAMKRLARDSFTVNSLDIDFIEESAIKVYPNPAKNYFEIQTDVEYTLIELFSVNGKCIYTNGSRSSIQKLSLEGIPNGVYTLVVSNKGTVIKREKLSVIR